MKAGDNKTEGGKSKVIPTERQKKKKKKYDRKKARKKSPKARIKIKENPRTMLAYHVLTNVTSSAWQRSYNEQEFRYSVTLEMCSVHSGAFHSRFQFDFFQTEKRRCLLSAGAARRVYHQALQ